MQAKRCILDFIGVALAGSTMKAGKIITRFVTKMGGLQESTVIRGGLKVPSPSAALANGTMAHIELDDGSRYAMGHPGVVVIPAALALAELHEKTGEEFITAVVLGYDVFVRIGAAMNPSHYRRGFHTTGTCGTFAAATAAVKLLNLNKQAVVHALGLAGTQSCGLFEFIADGSMSKELHPGRSAQSGVISALLAHMGFSGPSTILEGEKGVFQAMSDSYDPKKVLEHLGEDYKISQVYFKFHAACRHTHSAIDAVLQLKKEYDLTLEDIKKVVVRTYSIASEITNIQAPETPLAAKMSLPYSIAAALRTGRVGLEAYTEEQITNRKIQELARRVHVKADPDLDNLLPNKRAAIVEIKTTRFGTLNYRIDLPKGEPEFPASEEELQNKFRHLASRVLDEDTITTILKTYQNLERLASLDSLCKFLN